MSSFALGGNGPTGTGTLDPSAPPGQSGDADLATQYPDGTTKFTVYETCDTCSFQGKTGAAVLRVYGTTSASGATSGTFLVISGGPYLYPSPPEMPGGTWTYGESTGDLGTLVGYGSFTSAGAPPGTVNVVEHLGFG